MCSKQRAKRGTQKQTRIIQNGVSFPIFSSGFFYGISLIFRKDTPTLSVKPRNTTVEGENNSCKHVFWIVSLYANLDLCDCVRGECVFLMFLFLFIQIGNETNQFRNIRANTPTVMYSKTLCECFQSSKISPFLKIYYTHTNKWANGPVPLSAVWKLFLSLLWVRNAGNEESTKALPY